MTKVTEDEKNGKSVLPVTEFFYTLDQIAYVLNITVKRLAQDYIHFVGANRKTSDSKNRHKSKPIKAYNFRASTLSQSAEWRVPATELERFLHSHGLTVYERLSRRTGPHAKTFDDDDPYAEVEEDYEFLVDDSDGPGDP